MVTQFTEKLNPKQREAVEYCGGHELVLAGAGSGKTRVLTTKIAYLIEQEKILPWRILALTFTNKAAKEMNTRVEALMGFPPGWTSGQPAQERRSTRGSRPAPRTPKTLTETTG